MAVRLLLQLDSHGFTDPEILFFYVLLSFFPLAIFLFEFFLLGFGVLNIVPLDVCKLLGSFYTLGPWKKRNHSWAV